MVYQDYSADRDDHFSSGMADFDGGHGVGGFVERPDVLHVGIELAVGDETRHDFENAAGAVPLDHVTAEFVDLEVACADEFGFVRDQFGDGT